MNRAEVVMDPRSSDSTDQRRVHAVPPTPMYQGETKILDSLLKEVQLGPNSKPAPVPTTPVKLKEDDDRKLQKMLEKYQSEIKMQLQKGRGITGGTRRSESQASPISHSQPCLIASGSRSSEIPIETSHQFSTSMYQRRASASGDQALDVPTSNQRNLSSNQKLIQSLRDENIHLKKEMDTVKKNLSKLQQIEFSYGRLETEYEFLSNERKKQENLELNAIIQLEKTVKKLTIERDDLQVRLDKAVAEPSVVASLMMNEMQQRQELFACKERQKMEIEAQNQTLEEQRNHIAMLEKALANSQERLAKREKKCEELNTLAVHADELRKQLSESWEEAQRREQMIESERAQWEMEKTQLRMQLNKDQSQTGSLKRTATPGGTEDIIRMKKSLAAKDERIHQLERVVNDLRNTLAEETERRKSTLATITDSFEARIKHLDDEKLDRDLIINELKQERDKYAAMIDKSSGEDALNRMEEIRQKIQERKKKGRLGVTGGLVGMPDHHNRSSSSSVLQRRSSGPFDTQIPSSPTMPYPMYKHQITKSAHTDTHYA